VFIVMWPIFLTGQDISYELMSTLSNLFFKIRRNFVCYQWWR